MGAAHGKRYDQTTRRSGPSDRAGPDGEAARMVSSAALAQSTARKGAQHLLEAGRVGIVALVGGVCDLGHRGRRLSSRHAGLSGGSFRDRRAELPGSKRAVAQRSPPERLDPAPADLENRCRPEHLTLGRVQYLPTGVRVGEAPVDPGDRGQLTRVPP